ncbi:MAG TPA: hypothetical protein VKR82_04815 [Candidatus Acidoferrales bacterium]|nr:hypothetical protein [Candidatus Acidoferrales bacterium]
MKLLMLASVFGVIFIACDTIDRLIVKMRSGDIFRPKMGWRILYWFWADVFVAFSLSSPYWNTGPNRLPLWNFVAMILIGLVWIASWPRTLIADCSGISSCSIFGLGLRTVPWAEVSRVSSDWQEEYIKWGFDRIWTFMGTSLTVTSRDGASIQHGLMNRRQGQFLDVLRRYVPRDAFDPGIYDWHP